VGGSVHVLFLGVEANVSPYEVFDFFTASSPTGRTLDDITGDSPWDIRTDIADDDTPISEYDNHIDKFRHTTTTRSGRPSGRACGRPARTLTVTPRSRAETRFPPVDSVPDGGGGWRPIMKNTWTGLK
jgi:hypothetical protein